MQQFTKQLDEFHKQGKITENGYNMVKESIKNVQTWAQSMLEA
jgi:hypothetical protein